MRNDAVAAMAEMQYRIWSLMGVPHQLFGEVAKINVTNASIAKHFGGAAHWNPHKGWLLTNHGIWGTEYTCSRCGNKVYTIASSIDGRPDYCPHCYAYTKG